METEVAFPLTASGEQRIREVAARVLEESLPRLLEERVIPRAKYRPWIWMARDYYGHVVHRGELAEALTELLPGRFSGRALETIDSPWGYEHALVEGAIAAATLDDEPYEIGSPSIRLAIDELIGKLTSRPRATVIQLVSDVSLATGPPPMGVESSECKRLEVGIVRLVDTGINPEKYVEREIPAAGYEVDRMTALAFPGSTTMLAATVSAMSRYEELVPPARRAVQDLLTAIRLATGSTTRALVDIEGEPERVRWVSPTVSHLPAWGLRIAHRKAWLGSIPGAGLSNLLREFEHIRADSSPVAVAIARLNRSLDGSTPGLADQVIDLSIGLEAALSGNDRTEVGLRLRQRAAHLLEDPRDPADAIYSDVKTLYDLRSTFVHGGMASAKRIEKVINSVAGAERSSFPGERFHLALDRWRDLLRRAILARIALNRSAAWPTGRTSADDLDKRLMNAAQRAAWCAEIAAYWESNLLPAATKPAAPLTLQLSGT